MKTLLLIALSPFLLFCNLANAVTGCGYKFSDGSTRPSTIVLFVNGIGNTPVDACKSSDALAGLIGTTNYDRTYFYNPGDSLTFDVLELQYQTAMSETALLVANVADPFLLLADSNKNLKDTYYRQLGGQYNALTGSSGSEERVRIATNRLKERLIQLSANYQRIVVVAHSQGNFYIEAAYAMLFADGNTSVLEKIRVVGVACIAATTPNNFYITHNSDLMIYDAHWANSMAIYLSGGKRYKPLNPTENPMKFTGAQNAIATNGFHSFVSVYLSDQFYSPEKANKTYALITRDLVTTAATISSSPVAFGTWEARPQSGVFSAANVSNTAGVLSLTGAVPSFSEFRNRLSAPVSGDSFRIMFRAKCDPALGCSSAYDIYFGLNNTVATAATGVAAKGVAIGVFTGYSVDRININGADLLGTANYGDTRIWHTYTIEVSGGRAKYSLDGVVKIDSAYSGTVGPMDTVSVAFRGKGQFEASSVMVTPLP